MGQCGKQLAAIKTIQHPGKQHSGFFDLGTSSNTSLSISGGNDAANYRLSYSLAKADGVVPTNADSYLRNTFALSGGLKAGKVTINSTINYLNKIKKLYQQAKVTMQLVERSSGRN